LEKRRAFIMLHTAVLLFGFTGIVGEYIKRNEALTGAGIVWWRMAITLLSLLLFPKIVKKVRAIPPRDRLKIMGIGLLVAAHWVTFFGAIQMTNASITISILASAAFFTSLIEPIILKQPFQLRDSLLGATVILGFVFIFGFTASDMNVGILVAILSALLAATFGVMNKGMVARHDLYAITLLEFVAGVAVLSILAPLWGFYDSGDMFAGLRPAVGDWGWLVFLAIGCTTLAFTLTMISLKTLTAFTTALAINLEPIYTIVLAAILFSQHETMHGGFYIGAVIIILAVAVHPFLGKIFDRE
jgi:drug/metabolite transporter (DMT)-like permease